MKESLFQAIFDDALTLGILFTFVLFIIAKVRKESIKESIVWLKDLFRDKTEEQ